MPVGDSVNRIIMSLQALAITWPVITAIALPWLIWQTRSQLSDDDFRSAVMPPVTQDYVQNETAHASERDRAYTDRTVADIKVTLATITTQQINLASLLNDIRADVRTIKNEVRP